jgi:hypothetical protein
MTLVRLAIALIVVTLLPPLPANAQRGADRANALNDEGKALFAEKRYAEAHAKFNEAISLSPEGRFYFNACYTLNFLERYQEAIAACEAVEPNGADAKLIDKANKALESLRQKAAAQGGGGPGGPPTDPDQPGDPGPGAPPPGGPGEPQPGGVGGPASDPFVATKGGNADDEFKWSLGGELGGLANGSIGKDGDVELFAASGVSVRLFANFLLSERARFGFQGYFGFAKLGPGTDNPNDDQLNVVDFGGALWKAFRLTQHLYVTPLAGVHISLKQLDNTSRGFLSLGGRLEGALTYVLGERSQHGIGAVVGLNAYGPASGEVDGIEASDLFFDKASAAVSVGVSYQFRFSTPFGSTPLITLE